MTISGSSAALGRLLVPVAALSLGCLLGVAEALAAESWLLKSPGPEPLVRNARVYADTPVAGQAVVVVPTMANGIWKIVDNGTTLTVTPINNGLPMLRIRTVVGLDPTTLYAAVEGYGIYKTIDGGANWLPVNGSGPTALGCRATRNAVARTATEVWVVTACRQGSGVFRTLDGGATWARLGAATIPDDAAVTSITFMGTGATTAVAIPTSRHGFFRSADNGDAWAQVNAGIPAPDGANRIDALSIAFRGNANSLLAIVEGQGLFQTTNGGASWTAFGTGLPDPLRSPAGLFRESAGVFYVGTDKGPVYKTVNGGLNWTAWGNSGPPSGMAMYTRGVVADATAAGRYWVYGLDGLARTNDNGLTFNAVSIGEGYVTGFALHPDETTGYLAAETIFRLPDIYAPDTSAAVDVGASLPGSTLGGELAIDPAQPATLYASVPSYGLYKTINGGGLWTKVDLPNVQAGVAPVFAVSPSNGQVLYAAPGNKFGTATGGGFFKSINGGDTWTQSSTGLATPEARDINSIALSQAAPLAMLVTTGDGIYKSGDGGVNWSLVLQVNDGAGTPLPMGAVRFDPVDPLLAWATAAHANADGTIRASAGVWKSINGGDNWTQPLSGKRAARIRPEGSGRVIVQLERDLSQPAMLATIDGGTTWTPFNDGIVVNDAVDLSRNAGDGARSRVVFASMTSGIYVLDKPLVSVQVTGSGSVDSVPPGFSCTGSCGKRLFHGESWTLAATPTPGYQFAGWGGDCAGTGNCVLAIDGAKSVAATFSLLPPAADFDNDGIPNAVEVAEGTNPLVKDNDVFTSNRLFAMQQYRDFLGREGDAGGVQFYQDLLTSGAAVRANVIESFFNSPEFAGTVSPIVRLYFATFLRIPDYGGLQYQVNAYRTGTPLTVIANNFSLSPEFQARYGALSDAQYVVLLYQNVLGRTPVQAEIDYHVARLASGVTRGEVMVGFSESPEYQGGTFNDVYVTMMYVGMLGRAPEQAGFDYWVLYMDTGNPGINLILGFLNAPEYHDRFLP